MGAPGGDCGHVGVQLTVGCAGTMNQNLAVQKQLQTNLDNDAIWPPRERGVQNHTVDQNYARDARAIDFVVEGREALPEVVQARVNNMEDQMYSGFLPELNLAWVSVDDTICLWLPAPQDGLRPPPCSKTCKDYVLAVALVKPDPNKEYDCDGMPQYFLAVALRECVQLFKLEVTDTEISVHDTAIEIAIESYVKCMLATPTGRLFVGCNDGCVYELHYEEDDVSLSSFWRPRKFRKTACHSMISGMKHRLTSVLQFYDTQPVIDMCFDPSRHYLYALTAKVSEQRTTKENIAANTSIHLFSLTTKDGKGDGSSAPSHIFADSLINMKDDDGKMLIELGQLDKDVLSDRTIHPVLYSEDEKTHLVIVTASGWRIYLAFDEKINRLIVSHSICPPWPPDTSQSALQSGGSVSRARCCAYKNGLFLLGCDAAIHCVAKQWAGMSDAHSNSSSRNEVVQDIKANQLTPDPHGASLEVWQIEEMTSRARIGTVVDVWGPGSVAGGQHRGCCVPSVNEQWTQHICPPRRFVCIGAREVVIIHRLQPWEKLRVLSSEYVQRRTQTQDQEGSLTMSPEQACASLLLWWVRAGGRGGGARPEGRGRMSEADHAAQFFFKVAKEIESNGQKANRCKSPALPGILIALARFLRPVWEVSLFEANSPTQPIAAEWERLASEVQLIFTFVTEHEQNLGSDPADVGHSRSHNQQEPSVQDVQKFVQICKEVCALMAIVTKNGLGTLVQGPWTGNHTVETFKEALVKLAPGDDSHTQIRAHLKNVLDALIEQGTVADSSIFMQGAFGEGFRGGGVGRGGGEMHTATRDRLIRDIEEQCPTILKPSETSKMRARKSLVYARQALDQFSDRTRMMMHVREGKEMYDRVSKELECDDRIDDVKHMIQAFVALNEHLSALQVLLKRCSERDRLEEKEAVHLHELIITISQVPDRSLFTRALLLCLEHRGLYISKVLVKCTSDAREKKTETPIIDYVLLAVIRSPDYLSLWPILRKVYTLLICICGSRCCADNLTRSSG